MLDTKDNFPDNLKLASMSFVATILFVNRQLILIKVSKQLQQFKTSPNFDPFKNGHKWISEKYSCQKPVEPQFSKIFYFMPFP